MEITLCFHEAGSCIAVEQLDNLIMLVKQMLEKEQIMSEQLDKLTTEVAKTVAVQQSAILLLQGLSAQIAAMKDDPVALQALADSLDASSNALAEAIAINTPVA